MCLALCAACSGERRGPARAPCSEFDQEVVPVETCETACSGGSGEACAIAGSLLASGTRYPPDLPRAMPLFERGCELGASGACQGLIRFAEDPARVKKLERSRDTFLLRECDVGRGESCQSLAHGMKDSDPDRARILGERALQLFRDGCGAGDAVACDNLGDAFYIGWGAAPEDEAKAFEYWRKGCELDHAPSCHDLGDHLRTNAISRNQSIEPSVGPETKACDLGMAQACGALGSFGKDVAMMERACRLGWEYSCEDATEALATSDPARAIELAKRGCALTSQRSCKQLEKLGGGSAR